LVDLIFLLHLVKTNSQEEEKEKDFLSRFKIPSAFDNNLSAQPTTPTKPNNTSRFNIPSANIQQPTYDKTAQDIAGQPVDLKKMPSGFFDATLEGFGSMGLFIQPEVGFTELPGFRRKAGRFVGGAAGMVTVHLGLNALTGGSATLSAAALSASTKGYKALNTAGKLWKSGEKSLALANAGLGTTYSTRYGLKLMNNKSVDKFMNLAADNPEQALKMFVGRTVAKEAGIFTGYGQISATAKQLQSEEDFDIMKNLKAIPFDAAGGFFYSRLGLQSLRYQDLAKRVAVRSSGGFAAGFTSAALNSSEATFGERIGNGLAMGAFSSIINGTSVKVTRNQLGNSLRTFGDRTDEASINQLSKAALVKMEDAFKNMSLQYAGIKYTSKSGAFAKFKKIDYDKETDTFQVYYDSFNKGGKQTNINKKGEIVTKSKNIDDFYATYTNTSDDIIRVRNNIDVKGNKKSFFKTDKDVKTFSENKSWGIVSAVNGGYKFNLPIRPGENAEDALIREILSLGYKEKDIMKISTDSSMKDVFNSFIVKGLKDKDAITIGRLTGQTHVKTNKGMLEIVRKKGSKNDLEIDKVIYHSRIPGTTTIGETIFRGGVTKKRATPGTGVRTISKRPAKGDEKYTVANPAKFKDIDIEMVELEGGRVLAFGSQYAINKIVKNAKYPSKLKNELDFMELIGASRLKDADDVQLGLQNLIRRTELDNGLRNPDATGAHRALKLRLFGKTKTSQLTPDEITSYRGILSGLDEEELFISKLQTGIKNIDDVLLTEVLDPLYLSSIKLLPLYRKYDTLYNVTGFDGFKSFRDRMIRKEAFSEEIKSSIYTMRVIQEQIRKRVTGAGLFGISDNDFSEIMIGLIDPKFKYKLLAYDKKMITQVKAAANEHTKTMKAIDDLAIKYGVPVTKYVNGKRTSVAWVSEKDFMPLTVSSNFFDFINKNDSLYYRTIEDLRRKNPGLSEDGLKDLLKRLGKNTERNGIYGVQYSRTFDLDPVYFLDEAGDAIKITDDSDFLKKVGGMIGDKKIAQRIETYDMSYANNMDRYAGRIANILSLARYLGKDTEFKTKSGSRFVSGYSSYGTYFEDMFAQIRSFARSNKNKLKGMTDDDLVKMVQADADFLIKSEANSIGSRITGGLTNIAATLGLSGLISPLKNTLLGNTQTFATFSGKRFFEVVTRLIGSKDYRKLFLQQTRKGGGFSGGSKMLETTFSDNKASKGMTIGMTAAEMLNRLIAVPVGKLTADDALSTLLNAKATPSKKQKAASFLRDTMMLGDEYVDAVKNKKFSNEQRQMILVRSHATTQGLTGKPFILPFMDYEYAKPFTLFTRIATIVTDNVYNNVMKPARDGNPMPLVKYVVGTGLSGMAISETVHWLYNQPKRVFESMPEEIVHYLAYGEFLGAFGIAYDIADSILDEQQNVFDTFAVTRTGIALSVLAFGSVNQAVRYVRSNDDIGDSVKDDIKTREFIEQGSKASALTNNIYRISQRVREPIYMDYQNGNKLQRSFQETYGLKQSARVSMKDSEYEEKNAQSHKQYLKVLFYSDADPQVFINAYRAAINANAVMNIHNQGNAVDPKREYLAAVREMRDYLKQIDPILLGQTRSRGRVDTEYNTFLQDLKEKDQKSYDNHIKTVKFYKDRYYELLKYNNGQMLRDAYNDVKNYQP
jgi:hypothetical protein